MGALFIHVNGYEIQRIYRGGQIVWHPPEILSLPYDIHLNIVEDNTGSYGSALRLILGNYDVLLTLIFDELQTALAAPAALGNEDVLCHIGVDGYSYGTSLAIIPYRHDADHKVYLEEVAAGLAARGKVFSHFLDFKVYVTEAATATGAKALVWHNYYACTVSSTNMGTGAAAFALTVDHDNDTHLYVTYAQTGTAAQLLQVKYTSDQKVKVEEASTCVSAKLLPVSRFGHVSIFSTHENGGVGAVCIPGNRTVSEEIVRIVEGGPVAYEATIQHAEEDIQIPSKCEGYIHTAGGKILFHDVVDTMTGKTEGGGMPVPIVNVVHEVEENPAAADQYLTGIVVEDMPLDVSEPCDVEVDSNIHAQGVAGGNADKSEAVSLEELINLRGFQIVSVAADIAHNIKVETFAAISNGAEEPDDKWFDPVQTGTNLYIRSVWYAWRDGEKAYIDLGVFYEPVRNGSNLHIRSVNSVYTDRGNANIDTAFFLEPIQQGTDLHIRSAASICEYLTKE